MTIKRKIAACAAALVTLGASVTAAAQSADDFASVEKSTNSATILALKSQEKVGPNATIERRSNYKIFCDDGKIQYGGEKDAVVVSEEKARDTLRKQCLYYKLEPHF